MTETRELTPEQREAIESRDRDVFLQAGAGTGKTTVLVERLRAIVIDDEIGLDGVLAFTFTDRAADQLRDRVRNLLGVPALEGDWISTIHGFCRRLLSSHPAAAGIDPRYRVVDQAEADRLANRAFTDSVRELLSGDELDAAELVASHHARPLREAVRGAYAELRSRGEESPALPRPEASDLGGALTRLAEAAAKALPECESSTGELAAESCERMRRATALGPGSTPDLAKLQGLEIIAGGKKFKEEAAKGYKSALRRAKSAVAERELAGQYGALRRLVELFGSRYRDLKEERSGLDFEDLQLRARALLRDHDQIRAAYQERFAEIMVDEFQDTNELQRDLIELLRGADTRLFVVGDEFQSIYGFRHADLDVFRREREEFDRRPDEKAKLLPLLGNFRSTPDVIGTADALGRSVLEGFAELTVGRERATPDPPSVELLLTHEPKRGEWAKGEVELPGLLEQNSPAAIVAEARLLAARLARLRDEEHERPGDMVVLLRAFTHVGAFDRALADAGLRPYVVGGRGYWSQQQVEDLRAILATVANPLDDQALFGALASPACAVLPDTLWLLRKTASRWNEERQRDNPDHVWPTLEKRLLRGEDDGRDEYANQIPAEELERVRLFCERLSRLRDRGTEGGLEALVERAARTFGYDLATLARADGRQRWANVRKLMRLAREFEVDEGPDLAGFVSYLDDRADRDDREGEAATEAEGHDGVRVMTVHAAKGLEFPIVAVAHLGRGILAGFPPAVRVAPGGPGEGPERFRIGVRLSRMGRPSEYLYDYDDLKDRAEALDSAEGMRLAYVAATRAEDRLLLSGTVTDSRLSAEVKLGTPVAARLAREWLDGKLEDGTVELPAPEARRGLDARFSPATVQVTVSKPEPGAGAALLDEHEAPTPAIPEITGAPPLLSLPDETPTASGRLSYSALSDYTRCGYRFYVERVLGIRTRDPAPTTAEVAEERPGAGEPPTDELPGPADVEEETDATPAARARRYALGNAVHGLLEWSASRRWAAPSEDRVRDALRAEGLDPSDVQLGRASRLIGNWLASDAIEELQGAKLVPEAPFVLTLGPSLVRGSIDLLAERPDGGLLVVDYKTDRLGGTEPAEQMERYDVQRKLYAVAASLRGDGPVRTMYSFLEKPDDPRTHDHGPVEVAALRTELEGLVAELQTGEFVVTPTPHRALCHDCPAATRLCSYDREARNRRDPVGLAA